MIDGQIRRTTNLTYAVDIVLCIDVTESMGALLEEVKRHALTFHERLSSVMAGKGKSISQLRLKVIAFRDFGDLPDDAIQEAGFLSFPSQAAEFERFVRALRPEGGGDWPESGLEALALAIQAPWETGLDRRRHVIVMFTDAPAHPLGSPAQVAAPNYPPSIPRSMDQLFAQWGFAQRPSALMDNSAKRLLLFAPDEKPWSNIAEWPVDGIGHQVGRWTFIHASSIAATSSRSIASPACACRPGRRPRRTV